jgi:hypothetical protein
VSKEISVGLGEEVIEDRLFRNWVMVLAAYSVLETKIKLSFSRTSLFDTALRLLRIQQRETKNSNEISTFWSLVQYMYADGLIQEDVDFRIVSLTSITTDVLTDRKFETGLTRILFIQHARIIPLYRKYGKQHGEKILPSDSIDYYLTHDKRYLGKKQVRFKTFTYGTKESEDSEKISDKEKEIINKSKNTKAYCFQYDLIGITLHNEDEAFNKDDLKEEENKTKSNNVKNINSSQGKLDYQNEENFQPELSKDPPY